MQGEKIQNNGLDINANPKIKCTDIRERIGNNHYENHNNYINIKTIRYWWNKRTVFEETGKLDHKPRSGRPIHAAFATESKKEEVVDYCLNLPMGYHQDDVCEYFDIDSVKTLRKHTKNDINWVYAPKEHYRDNDEVKQKRIDFANWCLTPGGRLKKIVKDATFVDHKMVHFYGLNKRHFMQAKRIGDDYSNLDPHDYSTHDIGLMAYFACNRKGVAAFIHSKKRRKKKGRGFMVEINNNIDNTDVIDAFKKEFISFMQSTNSNYVIADGVKCQHKKSVYDYLGGYDIKVHPSACKPNNIRNGYPPYSHCFMPLDHRVFAPYQAEIYQVVRDEWDKYPYSRHLFLYDKIKKIYETDKYMMIAENAIANYAKVCKDVIKRGGDIKNYK